MALSRVNTSCKLRDKTNMSEPVPSQSGKSKNAFENALQTWAEIDLSSLQRKLDEQGIELKSEQKSSLASRKELASKTKEFKKLDNEKKLAEFNPLLKQYQNEIDNLTSKQKKAESFFFGFYRLIAEAPDPKPLLELSLDAIMEMNETAELKKEVARLSDELSRKADYDILKQRLLDGEQKSAELLGSKLKAKEEEFQALIEEKESNWQSVQKQHESQIAGYKATIEELRTSMEVTELQLSSQNKQLGPSSNSSVSILAELDLVTREVESWKKRVYELEKRNEDLRRELSVSQADSEKTSMQQEHAKKIAEIEGENAVLVANLNQLRGKLDSTNKEHDTQIQSLTRELHQSTQEIKHLKEKLSRTSDYDELKHELHLLRQIEFGEQEEDAGSEHEAGNFDALLIQHNKSLTKELAELRSQHESLTSKISSLEAELTRASSEYNKMKELNAKMENDLANFQDAYGSNFNDSASMMSGMTRMTRPVPGRGSTTSLNTVDENSILPIITGQRDRFRDRNKELEDEVRKQANLVNELKRKNKMLQTDNEELYEKTRYMASIKDKGTMAPANSNRRTLIPKANSSDLESNPYRASYESKLHPIEQFRKQEQERVSSRLSPFERMFIFVTRSILATRLTRMLFLVYCVFLHCLVMFTTIHSMSMSTSMIPEVGLNESTGGVTKSDVPQI
ncbi:CASP C terminal family protein [Clavispora lusitaniae]|uniref:CASP C terminal family protein n=1 Tax=Clavispora lusitaniae TaxID=36911 RepID=UPI00202C1CDE|nr:CASP C terminal family protein [Clavispora lusitaniae]